MSRVLYEFASMSIKLKGLPGLFAVGVVAGLFVVGLTSPDTLGERVAIAVGGGLAACVLLPSLGWLILKVLDTTADSQSDSGERE